MIFGKTSELLGASSALLLNALKELAGIPHENHVISPEAIRPIQELKTQYLGSKNPRLHTDETLIALSVSAANNPEARKALEQLPSLRGCQAHTSVMLSSVDIWEFRKLGIELTCEPKFEKKKKYIINSINFHQISKIPGTVMVSGIFIYMLLRFSLRIRSDSSAGNSRNLHTYL